MIVVEGYFDESGDLEAEPGIFAVAGYFITSSAAKAMDEEWEMAPEKYRVPYFHMVDCAHGNGVFKKLTRDERISLVTELVALIKAHTTEGYAFLAERETYDLPPSEAPDIYSYCAEGCALALNRLVKERRIDGGTLISLKRGTRVNTMRMFTSPRR